MGACILCGKSAGLFYSLHKACFEKYNSSNLEIGDLLRKELGREETISLVQRIDDIVRSYDFAEEAQQRTLIRALEYFPKNYIEDNASFEFSAWIEFLRALPLKETLFINSNFLAQQENLPVLKLLQNNILPEANCNQANFSIELQKGECLWWCFDKGAIDQLNPVENDGNWSVVTQIINDVLRKKKKPLEQKRLGEGKILLTNQRVCFEGDKINLPISHKSIYACTPVMDGVRLQINEPGAMPQTYVCEDGRLLFKFIEFARSNQKR